MNWTVFAALTASFLLTAILVPRLIPVLHRLKFGQQVRKEGNQEHLKKQGTPTMGGIIFIPAAAVVALVIMGMTGTLKQGLPVLLLTLGFGLVGFLDDRLKVVKKQSEGLKPLQKLALQFMMTAGFAYYCYTAPGIGSAIVIPFTGGQTLELQGFYFPFVFLVVMGTDNGVNFTDGLDGLCSSVTAVVALLFLFMAGEELQGLGIVSACIAGALMGFLLFNAYPAKIFMGDTGSLALGGFVAASALAMRQGLLILIFGLIYLIEVLSVILQVGYFKATHGKRIFKMAPIHHHFELSGWSETRIVALFTIVTVILSVLAFLVK